MDKKYTMPFQKSCPFKWETRPCEDTTYISLENVEVKKETTNCLVEYLINQNRPRLGSKSLTQLKKNLVYMFYHSSNVL